MDIDEDIQRKKLSFDFGVQDLESNDSNVRLKV